MRTGRMCNLRISQVRGCTHLEVVAEIEARVHNVVQNGSERVVHRDIEVCAVARLQLRLTKQHLILRDLVFSFRLTAGGTLPFGK